MAIDLPVDWNPSSSLPQPQALDLLRSTLPFVTMTALGCTPIVNGSAITYHPDTGASNTAKVVAYLAAIIAGTEWRPLHLEAKRWAVVLDEIKFPASLPSFMFIGGGGPRGDVSGFEQPNYTGTLVAVGGSGPLIEMQTGNGALTFDRVSLQGISGVSRAAAIADTKSEIGILMQEYASAPIYTSLNLIGFETGIQCGTTYNTGDNADQVRGGILTGTYCDKIIWTRNIQSCGLLLHDVYQFMCRTGLKVDGGGKISGHKWLVQDSASTTRMTVMDLDGMSRNHMSILMDDIELDGGALNTDILYVRSKTCHANINLRNPSIPVLGKAIQFTIRDLTQLRIEAGSVMRRGQVAALDESDSGYSPGVLLRDCIFDDAQLDATHGPATIVSAADSYAGGVVGGAGACVCDWSGCRNVGSGAFSGTGWARAGTSYPIGNLSSLPALP